MKIIITTISALIAFAWWIASNFGIFCLFVSYLIGVSVIGLFLTIGAAINWLTREDWPRK